MKKIPDSCRKYGCLEIFEKGIDERDKSRDPKDPFAQPKDFADHELSILRFCLEHYNGISEGFLKQTFTDHAIEPHCQKIAEYIEKGYTQEQLVFLLEPVKDRLYVHPRIINL